MKKFYSLILVLVLFCGVFLGGCGVTLSGGPASTDTVTSNGSMVVRKGDYLYFVNGYQSNSDLSGSQNDYGNVQLSALYRAKLNSDGTLKYNEEGDLTDIELLIPKVAGTQNMGIYIFGNKIFYLTPTTLKDSTGKVRFDLVDFCSANLNGSGVSTIYGAQKWTTATSKFNFVKVGEFVYLTIYDGSNLISIKLNSDGKIIYNKTISKDVTSVAFDTFTTYNPASEDVEVNKSVVYFTRSLTEDDSATIGNFMGKFNLGEEKATKVVMDNINTYTAEQVNDGILYYTKKNINQTTAYWYFKNLNTLSFENAQETQLTATSYDKVMPLEFDAGNNRGVIVSKNSKIRWLKNLTNLSEDVEISSTALTSMTLVGNDIIGFNSSGVLCKLNIATKTLTELTKSDEVLLYASEIPTLIDYDNYYVYYYKQYIGDKSDSAYYLSRMDISKTNAESEFIGDMLEKHIKTEEK